jgi:hypothetical protein
MHKQALFNKYAYIMLSHVAEVLGRGLIISVRDPGVIAANLHCLYHGSGWYFDVWPRPEEFIEFLAKGDIKHAKMYLESVNRRPEWLDNSLHWRRIDKTLTRIWNDTCYTKRCTAPYPEHS